jgi:hypothetical protein
VARHLNSDVARPRPDAAAHRRLRLTAGTAAFAAVSLLTGAVALPAGPAGAKSTTTTTKAHQSTTTTTAAGHSPSQADKWLLKAIGAEAKIGSVRIDGKIQQNKTVIYLDLVVNSDGEGGGTFVQDGFNIELERVGTLLYLNAPKKYWDKNAPAAQAKTYGGRWLEFSALDARFISFDNFLDADALVFSTFEGHTTPLTMGKPTTFQGHKVVVVNEAVVSNGKRATGSMYIGSTGKPLVYKIVDNTPGHQSTIVFSRYGKAVPLTVPPNAINLT